jgi:hypothetical protein
MKIRIALKGCAAAHTGKNARMNMDASALSCVLLQLWPVTSFSIVASQQMAALIALAIPSVERAC